MDHRATHHPDLSSIRTRPALGAALTAGIIASLVFQILEIILIPLVGGGSPWGPTRMIAAMVLGPRVLPPPATFELNLVLVAFGVDVVLAMIYSVAINWITGGLRLSLAIAAGAALGVVLYALNFYGLIALFPWFVMGRNAVTVFTHVVFSVTAVLAYHKLHARPSPGV